MVDSYLWGNVSRISPEAPVPIVAVDKRENRLGGAANVALNVKAMGANPILCSVVGNDPKGSEFIELLELQNMETAGILKSNNRITTTKFRVIGNNVQMLRVDEETEEDLKEDDFQQLCHIFEQIISQSNIDVIIFQDYDKGVITENLIKLVVSTANKNGIPVAVDPKKKNFKHFKDVTLFKPNLKELKEGLNIEFNSKNRTELESATAFLNSIIHAKMQLITLSEDGIFIRYGEEESCSTVIPSNVRSISDVSGAGDTVIGVASLCLAKNVSAEDMAFISNLAGGLVCEKVGVVPVDKERLIRETIKLRD